LHSCARSLPTQLAEDNQVVPAAPPPLRRTQHALAREAGLSRAELESQVFQKALELYLLAMNLTLSSNAMLRPI
jgi:hypothetical protein